MTEFTKEQIISWVQKEYKQARECALNNIIVFNSFHEEMTKFDSGDGTANIYAVRLAVDHKQQADRDKLASEMLEQILKIIE